MCSSRDIFMLREHMWISAENLFWYNNCDQEDFLVNCSHVLMFVYLFFYRKSRQFMVNSKSIKYQAYVTGIMPSNWVEINTWNSIIMYMCIIFKIIKRLKWTFGFVVWSSACQSVSVTR